jgi:hypothetical protein
MVACSGFEFGFRFGLLLVCRFGCGWREKRGDEREKKMQITYSICRI